MLPLLRTRIGARWAAMGVVALAWALGFESAGCSSGAGVVGNANAGTPSDASLLGDPKTQPASDANSVQFTDNPSDADSGQPPGTPSVRLIGRFDLTDPARPTAEWSGSAMQARFSGTSVSAKLGGANNYFAVVLDGVTQPVVKTNGSNTYPIATGLSAGTHDVLVFRRDEAFDQPAALLGFDFGGGQLLAPPAAPSRRIELIGDSISAGYGDECAKASERFSAATENEYIAYGPLAARALGADIHVIAWSGKGLYRNLDGTMTETMPILWQRTLPTDKASRWDPSMWIPDAVVINLGTNDFGAQGGDPSAAYQTAYLQLVTDLRGVYPGAFFFCAVGPMLSGNKYSAASAAIANVVATRKTAGDARAMLVSFPTQNCGADLSGCGCDYHPNAAEHQAMADVLVAAMRGALGW